MVFHHCFSDDSNAVVMRVVPVAYKYSVAWWERIYAYQYTATRKAMRLGDCP